MLFASGLGKDGALLWRGKRGGVKNYKNSLEQPVDLLQKIQRDKLGYIGCHCKDFSSCIKHLELEKDIAWTIRSLSASDNAWFFAKTHV